MCACVCVCVCVGGGGGSETGMGEASFLLLLVVVVVERGVVISGFGRRMAFFPVSPEVTLCGCRDVKIQPPPK